MTITSDPAKPADPKPAGQPTETKPSAAELARQRRSRRNAKIAAGHSTEPMLVRVRINAKQVPFVAVLVALLGAGLAGVLWLNTMTDEAGIRTNAAKISAADAQQTIEQLESDIAAKNATPAIAAAAAQLGLVPAGDAAILVVPADPSAEASVIGTPTAVVDPVAVAAAAAAEAAAQQAAAEQAAAAQAAAAQAAAEQAAAEAAAQAAAASQAAAAQAAAEALAAEQAAAAQSSATDPAVTVDPSAGTDPVTTAADAAATDPGITDTATTPGAAG